MDFYGFYTGKIFDAYEYLGCHLLDQGAVFRVYAPKAERVVLIGDFNGWQEWWMEPVYDGNFWEITVPHAVEGQCYKYKIYAKDGTGMEHCDPYGYGMELRPKHGSIIRNMKSYQFHDHAWMKRRTDCKDKPLNIYEIHAGSWKENPFNENGWQSYYHLAELIVPYVKEMGYNYIELMPISEHPSDNSWGYQNTGFYSPTSRYGTADELKYFVDKCHQNNIGVILDYVPVHFAVDGYALANFDGTPLYEYPYDELERSEWGSKNFNFMRGEVRSFLQSNAHYWLEEYHFDGLRIDALSNLVYWQGNSLRGENISAIDFVKHMNYWMKKKHPGIILAAEDSTTFAGVTKPVEEGGLGFDYKWDMGWMNDTLSYFKEHPYDRKRDYHKLTFSMMYYYSENFMLPFSHDEVVHGKATIVQKMFGLYGDKFAQARALYMYMYAHPGKKLNFMGNELAQFREWDERREQEWDMLQYPAHHSFHQYMKQLNHIYLKHPSLSERDYSHAGFQWIDCAQEEKRIYAMKRHSEKETIIAVFNFSDENYEYEMELDYFEKIKLLLASNDEKFGGDVHYANGKTFTKKNGKVTIPMGRYSGLLFTAVEPKK